VSSHIKKASLFSLELVLIALLSGTAGVYVWLRWSTVSSFPILNQTFFTSGLGRAMNPQFSIGISILFLLSICGLLSRPHNELRVKQGFWNQFQMILLVYSTTVFPAFYRHLSAIIFPIVVVIGLNGLVSCIKYKYSGWVKDLKKICVSLLIFLNLLLAADLLNNVLVGTS